MTTTPASCAVRKIHRVGRSAGVIIPPDKLLHLNATIGDYLYFSTEAPGFLIIHVAPVPPIISRPDLFPPSPAPPNPDQPHPTSDLPGQESIDLDLPSH